ncbi:light-mediated development protein DET1 isoform X1 [Cryptomeria japonica]|uniref:light-mediated development protein DET1 isoform X1 n=1 Tax=Cryptomeria japonica TaxID=3369 RepID=UPI0025AD7EA8|nr:light-mediated development protein DET1 isoform X1 [Cryptomeria japonica]
MAVPSTSASSSMWNSSSTGTKKQQQEFRMLKRNGNIVERIFNRQISISRPNTQIQRARQFYENLVPSYTIYDIECPDHSFRKFTSDGNYLICFSRSYQELIVYRHRWLSYCYKGEDCECNDLPPKAKNFESYFSLLYSIPLTSSNEFICKEFFLYMENNQFGIVATSTAPDQDAPISEGAIQGVPSIEKITFYLVRLTDGEVMDERTFQNDFIHLGHNMGVFLYDDLLSIMSIRYQTIYILQIRDAGTFVDVRAIGTYCREDDELILNSQTQGILNHGKETDQEARSDHMANGMQQNQQLQSSTFLGGIKQRLLSFIFRSLWNEDTVPMQRVQHMKRFYYHFQHYVDLVMWKVQFLDRHHLLIKFGSVDGGVSRSSDYQTAFFAVYNMETTEVVAFYQNSSEELLCLFEQYCDQFRVPSPYPLYMRFISSYSNNVCAREQLRKQKDACIKNKASSYSQLVRKTLTSLPFNSQSQSPSPYFDQSLFHFDEKLISATDRHRPCMEHPIKFISKRCPNSLKFKINPGLEVGGSDGRAKRVVSFLFHPVFPFALSIQQSITQPSVITVVNIHLRR